MKLIIFWSDRNGGAPPGGAGSFARSSGNGVCARTSSAENWIIRTSPIKPETFSTRARSRTPYTAMMRC